MKSKQKRFKDFDKTLEVLELARKVKRTYHGMRRRCDLDHKHYGARGIKCLYSSYGEIIDDIGLPPGKEYSIDRIDNDGHYEPGNCRWTSMTEQARNKRTNKLTASIVSEIKYLIELGLKSNVIADKYKVSSAMIRQIKNESTWKDVQAFPMHLYSKVY